MDKNKAKEILSMKTSFDLNMKTKIEGQKVVYLTQCQQKMNKL